MSEEKKDLYEEETFVEEEEVIEETKSEGFLTKVKTGLKKHGKKLVAGAAVAAVGLIGYALGAKSKEGEDTIDADNYEVLELEDHSTSNEVEVTEE